ncbi:hypothetical protein GCK72_004627 [Caenorhabditis remanei]|uniref:F-box domain-containing protein n=1 Tax=Caenorhabditis remanei TaxID=31234 RepID=A0A6A5HA90_CAERE|nr:hypothetical protein GCK72_004627 [Caenorhabditis remanei]KAF1764678.1 hypothetical protein GCK72_004627 [Caenorhabditis remanei]
MTSTSPPFPLFRLPYLPLDKVLRSFECGDLIEFSTCSKRCKQIVKSTRNEFTGIKIQIMRNFFSLMVDSNNGLESMWMSSENDFDENVRYFMLSGENIKIQGVNSLFHVFYPPQSRKLIFTSLVDHIVEILQIPIISVDFTTDQFDRFLQFVPSVSNSRRISFYGDTAMSRGDREFVRNIVNPDCELTFWPPI